MLEKFWEKESKMPLTIDKETIERHPLYKDGIEKGKLEAKKEDILSLYNELKLEPEKIAEILKVPVGFVKEVLKVEDK